MAKFFLNYVLHTTMCACFLLMANVYMKVQVVQRIACFSMCLSSELIIGLSLQLLSVAKMRVRRRGRRRRKGQNHSPSSAHCQNPQLRPLGVMLFLGNPAPWIAHQGGHFRSKAGLAAEMHPEFLINVVGGFLPCSLCLINQKTLFLFKCKKYNS